MQIRKRKTLQQTGLQVKRRSQWTEADRSQSGSRLQRAANPGRYWKRSRCTGYGVRRAAYSRTPAPTSSAAPEKPGGSAARSGQRTAPSLPPRRPARDPLEPPSRDSDAFCCPFQGAGSGSGRNRQHAPTVGSSASWIPTVEIYLFLRVKGRRVRTLKSLGGGEGYI